ncbi:MAG: hypothetical protein LBO62_02235 [Endomicrobium sp.]|nr:hypothetical protein [Endomicrobium sp.]
MKNIISVSAVLVFIFSFFFCSGAFAAQEGVDIANPEEAQTNAELEKTGFEEKYGDASDFSYSGEEEKAKAKAKAKVSKPSATKTLEPDASDKSSSKKQKPLLSGIIEVVKSKLVSAAANKEAVKIFDTISKWKGKAKNVILNLPGIRHYNNSIYSKDNYKKEINKFSGEYKKHLEKDSQGVKMLKEGAKEF